jgi:hypothetical protein
MVAAGIMLIVFGVAASSYIIFQRLWKGGFTQITSQSAGRVALEKISRDMRSAKEKPAQINGGDGIEFTTFNGIRHRYYVTGTDLVYDPDTAVANNETVLLRNVARESTTPFFQVSGSPAKGKLATITFKVYRNDAAYGQSWSTMKTAVTIRND